MTPLTSVQETSLRRCPRCRVLNRADDFFCYGCGTRLFPPGPSMTDRIQSPTCPHCGTDKPPGMIYCQTCGVSVTKDPTCPHCDRPTQHGSPHCDHCGETLSGCPRCGGNLVVTTRRFTRRELAVVAILVFLRRERKHLLCTTCGWERRSTGGVRADRAWALGCLIALLLAAMFLTALSTQIFGSG